MQPFTLFTLFTLALFKINGTLAAPAAFQHYYFRTRVVPIPGHNDTGTNKDGLWVTSYHTGAGTSDAVLVSDKAGAWAGYLNNTQLLFNSTIGPWPMYIEYASYQEWNVVTISIASEAGPGGFFINGTGLQNNESVAGWVACDWWHYGPQLFNINEYTNYKLPSSCSKINLHPVPV